ncbi:MAG: HAD family phosphatase [Lachnospiraceae bacterium]|nr:HAD family phosphatase [Lachnospiraceae bacterium]
MQKTIIFDIGGVLTDYDWRAFMTELFNNDKDTVDIMCDTMFMHGIWDELDRGVWSEEKLLSEFIKIRPDYEKEIRLFYEESPKALTMSEYTRDWIKEIKAAGANVLYLSNYSEHVIKGNYSALEFLDLVDGGVFSCYVNLIKPDREIFQCICDKYSLDKSKCLFIDDKNDNIIAAKEFGMNAVRFENYEQAHKAVEEFIK